MSTTSYPSLDALPKVDIVIVNWNAGAQLRDCVNSLGDLVRSPPCHGAVVVVDNGSTDDSLKFLETYGNSVLLLKNKANRGFARACNQGAQAGYSQYILFLNPDTRIESNTVSQVLDFMRSSAGTRVAVCGVKTVNAHDATWRTCTRLPTARMFAIESLGLDRVFPFFTSHFMREWDHLTSADVEHVIGAFYFIRRSVFEEVGGFDERFFVYLEDLDLSWRVSAAGWGIRYLAEPQIFHQGGGVSRQVKAARLFYSLRSKLLFARKHFSLVGFLVVACVIVFIEPCIRLLRALAVGDRARSFETIRAYGKLYRWVLAGAPSEIEPAA